MTTTLTPPVSGDVVGVTPSLDDRELRGVVAKYVGAWPSAGLAVGIVRDGRLEVSLGVIPPIDPR